MKRFRYLLLCVLLASTPMVAAGGSGLPVAGWIEDAVLMPQGLRMRAKLDTGAQTSSINARHVTEFEKDSDSWVRFDVTNFEGDTITLERPVTREASIKRHFTEPQLRKVIELTICVGPIKRKVEVSLVDRSRFEYQLLIGRNFMKNAVLVDSGNKNLLTQQCIEQ